MLENGIVVVFDVGSDVGTENRCGNISLVLRVVASGTNMVLVRFQSSDDVMRQRPDYDSAIVQAMDEEENSLPLWPRFQFLWSDLLISPDTPHLMSFGAGECAQPPTPKNLNRSIRSK